MYDIEEVEILMDTPKLLFSPIDSKGWPIIGINTDSYGNPGNNHNAILMGLAEGEYLMELNKLQQRIRDKYETRLINNEPGPFDQKDADYREMKASVIDVLYPGDYSNLWYS